MVHNEQQYRVYIETTIPSFYYTLRTDTESRAKQNWIRKWWEEYADQFTLVSSGAVIDELRSGKGEKTQKRINLIKDLEILPVPSRIHQIAQTYIIVNLVITYTLNIGAVRNADRIWVSTPQNRTYRGLKVCIYFWNLL